MEMPLNISPYTSDRSHRKVEGKVVPFLAKSLEGQNFDWMPCFRVKVICPSFCAKGLKGLGEIDIPGGGGITRHIKV